MKFSAKRIAEYLNGEIIGNPDVVVDSFSKIEEGKEGSLSFLANSKYTPYLYNTQATIVIVDKDYPDKDKIKPTLIKVKNAYQAFASLLKLYDAVFSPKRVGIEDYVFIDKTAKYGKNVYIASFSYVGKNVEIADDDKIYPQVYIGDNVKIGKGTVIHSGVKIYHNCIIGSNCTIHSGAIIGSDGFGFAPQEDGYEKVYQIGNVIIEDNVEIGANTTIDRATLGSTIVRKGVKLDNLIQVAHNVEIGDHTVIAAQTGISGSTKLGKYCMIGGQVGFVGHIYIADEVKIAAQSGVEKTVKNKGEVLQGSPAYGARQYQRSYVIYRKLPDLYKKIYELEKLVKELSERLGKEKNEASKNK